MLFYINEISDALGSCGHASLT